MEKEKGFISKNDARLIEMLKKIAAKGHNAEVKQNKDGSWIIYDVKKEKTMVG